MQIFDLVSDLHLETGGIVELISNWKSSSDVLIMAGDIVEIAVLKRKDNQIQKQVRTFFQFISKTYEVVYWVFGNHEHYGGIVDFDFRNAETVLQKLNIFNIHILNNESMSYKDIAIFGGTLWTSMRDNPMVMARCQSGMNDYVYINRFDEWLEKRTVSPYDTVMLHTKTKNKLLKFLEENKTSKKLVITHHAPSFQSISERYKTDSLNDAYATELFDLIYDSNINIWCHGHLHDAVNYTINQCQVVSNPKGYSTQTLASWIPLQLKL